ncbi:SDR family NAD(P)-dependent oxidoreductase [Belnapia moabensis]|uniref:SDR family NAD(P)-dependent oxidoreductase n=1 Tax=Belnapia moabensis TaxID=365533 RepID=UPI0005BDE7DB|nr:SDR family NAD(P)-dependent oxidoreductase [Belnapia moabensis]
MSGSTGRFASKVAVVAGGASGIGLAILRGLHDEGASIVCADVNQERLDAVERDFEARVACTMADVTKEAEVEAMMGLAVERFGGLDCAFNVAGASRPGYIVDLSETAWDFTVDLCLKGVFLCTKHAARQMLGRGGGAIVNIASLNAHVPMHAGAAYAAAKAGVEMLTKNAALELTPDGIRVNAVLPGLVETPLTRRHFENRDAHAAFMARIPAGRAAQPEEIAGPALFLASEEARYVSGASLLVDGAWAVTGYPDMRPFRGAPAWTPRV